MESKKGTIEDQEEQYDTEKQPQFDVCIVGVFIVAFVVMWYKKKK